MNKPSIFYILNFLTLILLSCTTKSEELKNEKLLSDKSQDMMIEGNQLATFGAGCFWCVEAVFTELRGVSSVVPGYCGGFKDNPTYKEVCSGSTGHAEVAQISYDSMQITFDELLEVFWKTHDPTTLNRQGNDQGTQYRSAIFYHNDGQKEIAEKYKKRLNEENAWPNPVVTEISKLEKFYTAEDYHNDYYKSNPDQGYCKYVIQPKVEKFRKAFSHQLK